MRRVSVLLAAFGLIVSFAAPGPVSADASRPTEYLALGDSLAFGFSPLLDRGDADNFVGYPEALAPMLRDSVTNASCPGETSSHFISLAGDDFGCGTWRTYFPLHAAYTTTQLAFVDAFLQAHPKTALVTIDIGANDVGRLRDSCLPTPNPMGCVVAGLPGVLATYADNLDTIYRHIRVVDGYRHKLVALTFYSPNYADAATTWAVSQVNQVLVERTLDWGGSVADGFTAFAAASAPYGGDTCAAGLRIVTAVQPLACDDHPSVAGRDLLAQTIYRTLRAD